jgi:uncharacterized protein YcgI (DUF1989 family)
MASDLVTIPARRGKAAHLRRGQSIKIINTHGAQVIDTWAFVDDHLTEFMSMEHTRTSLLKLIPAVGDALVTNKRRPILMMAEDTTPGAHDTLIAACDNERYGLLGCTHYHDNCTDNLHAGLAGLGLRANETPAPLNLFMNIPWNEPGRLFFEAPTCRKGDYVILRAEIDCVVAMSACPQDLLPINGTDCKPTEAHFRILD